MTGTAFLRETEPMWSYSRRSVLAMMTGAALGAAAASTNSGAELSLASVNTGLTRYGVNATTAQDAAARMRTFGAVGITRCFYPAMLPSTWQPSREGSSPDRATQVSFKAPPAAVAAGTHDNVIRSWMNSIPAGWTVHLTFWHEPNDELRDGVFSSGAYRAAWARIARIQHTQAQLRPGVSLRLVPVFMSYQVNTAGAWSDSWVPRPDEVAFVSWDVYGNPSGGVGLDGPYPEASECLDPCLRVTSRLGFATWGVTEFNTPRRTWDPLEAGRTDWLESFRQYALSIGRSVLPALGDPQFMLLWEGLGENWDQRFHTETTKAWWRSVITPDRLPAQVIG